MNVPDLKSLQCGDAVAWDAAFHWLWPVAFEVVRNKLSPFLPADIEDVAFEALEELIEKVREVNRTEELKPLLASISHHRAVDLLRERFSQKRGEGRTESLDATPEEQADDCEPVAWESPLNSLEQKELVEGLRTTLATLKPPLGDVLEDFFLHEMSYEEIAQRHGIAVGSVGVYRNRGLEAMRSIWGSGSGKL